MYLFALWLGERSEGEPFLKLALEGPPFLLHFGSKWAFFHFTRWLVSRAGADPVSALRQMAPGRGAPAKARTAGALLTLVFQGLITLGSPPLACVCQKETCSDATEQSGVLPPPFFFGSFRFEKGPVLLGRLVLLAACPGVELCHMVHPQLLK